VTPITVLRSVVVAAAAALLVAVPAAPAAAHGDLLLADETRVLDARESLRFEGEVHYHRLVGRVEADGPVAVRLIDSESGRTVVERAPTTSVALNELIRCCDGRVWAPHTLVVENPGPNAVTVETRFAMVHDDLAVMVDGAEDGTRSSIALFAIGWVVLLWRLTRRPGPLATSLRPVRLLGAVVAALVGLATYGAVRYGEWGAPAVVAALFDVPVLPANAFVSRASVLMGVSIALWYWASARWVRARGGLRRRTWLATGMPLIAVPPAAGALVFLAYGRAGVPLAWTAAAILPMIAVMVRSSRPSPSGPIPHLSVGSSGSASTHATPS
jgi:hypothetical protein